jgi:hypothetical protein
LLYGWHRRSPALLTAFFLPACHESPADDSAAHRHWPGVLLAFL